MKRGVAPTLAFYIGIVCILVSLLVKGFGLGIPIAAISFIHFANAWFLITIVCYVHDIWINIGGEIKKPKEDKPIG